MTTIDLTCPTCGTVSYFEELNRDASAFCRVCDYPLFWVRSRQIGVADGAVGDAGLRRLPGTAGRVALAMMSCPVCTEPNPVTGTVCIRCGSDLHPAPVLTVEAPPPPPPPPVAAPPPPPKRVIWPWIALGVAALVAIVILIVLLANN